MTKLVNNFFEVGTPDIEKVVAEQSMAENVAALRKTIDLANQHGDYDRQADRPPFTVPSIEDAFSDTESTMLGGNRTISHNICTTAIAAVLKLALDNKLPLVAKEVISIAEDRYIGLQGGGSDADYLQEQLAKAKSNCVYLSGKQYILN
jgi:hypothetical protein